MGSVSESAQARKTVDFTQKQTQFEVVEHVQNKRLYHIRLDDALLKRYFEEASDVDVQRLTYVAFERFALAGRMIGLFGKAFAQTLEGILNDRYSGGFTIGVQGQTANQADYIKFATALTHIVGIPQFDNMSGNYFATFAVKDADNSDSYLREAYKTMTLHTDGAYEEEGIIDWLLMMKMEERNAQGGNSRLLHIDDWDDLEKFSMDPIASNRVKRMPSKSKNIVNPQYRPTFFWKNGAPCICFAEQNVKPSSLEEGVYFKALSKSLESCPAILSLVLPKGQLVVVNNLFWLHGRDAFVKHSDLYRALMRQRGYFRARL